MENQYNVLIDFVGALLVGAILFTEHRQRRQRDVSNSKLLKRLMRCCILIFFVDIPGLLLDGLTFPGAKILLWFLDSFYWVLQAVYSYLWMLFAENWAFGNRQKKKIYRYIYVIPMIAEILIILINPWTGWIFTIDEQNVYARGTYYIVNMLPYVIYIIAAFTVTIAGNIKANKEEQNRSKMLLAVYMFLPVCGLVFDIFVYGISWIWPMVALSLMLVYLHVQQQLMNEEQLNTAKMQSELTESRMSVMLSQIQPHFLYNSLGVIVSLCESNPQLARKATVEFADFLRRNLDSLKMDKPISFEQELEHTNHYLTLEKIRFQEQLKIEYDITTSAFRLPTLTLQPLVENAVRYGVTKKDDGGTVKISTRESDQEYIIMIEDDGVGFCPWATQEDGRSHIGISNVRDRLNRMCNGSLSIQSEIGKGTKTTITIPKEATV